MVEVEFELSSKQTVLKIDEIAEFQSRKQTVLKIGQIRIDQRHQTFQLAMVHKLPNP